MAFNYDYPLIKDKYTKKQVVQINQYGRHQNFLATQGKEAVPFEKWIYDKTKIL